MYDKRFTLLFISIFMLGIFTGNFLDNFGLNIEKPLSSVDSEISEELASPSDWIKENQIYVFNDKVVINLKNPQWAAFTDTNSMDPIVDETSNAIEIVPKSEDDIHIGDIVSYESKYADGVVLHRVIDIGYDSKGKYFILKGDNNPEKDPGKVRFEQIKRVLVAVIY